MKPLNVKSTMLEKLLNLISPHYCCSCGEIGDILCSSCNYDITNEQFNVCIFCHHPAPSGKCSYCRTDIERSWCGGERTGALERLIDSYKFDHAVAAYKPLGEVILASLPELPSDTTIVPIPTLRAHIRQRGYDHALLIASYIAEKRGLECRQLLVRRGSGVQRGADRKTRITQAKAAFKVDGRLHKNVPYLLIDDVITTGSTLRYGAKAMNNAGATTVWAAVAARQPLD